MITGVIFLIFLLLQEQKVGGPCEGCEAIFEYGNKNLTSTYTLPDYQQKEPKMKIHGKVYKKDGVTPASDVIIYIYHTDQRGIYPKKGSEKGWASRHGYLRGWVKTSLSGDYEFYTIKPAPYPSGNTPAHVHITIKEPQYNEYYIDAYHFEGDPYLTKSERENQKNRGGSGIIKLSEGNNGIIVCKRDIILGKNIPNYPSQ